MKHIILFFTLMVTVALFSQTTAIIRGPYLQQTGSTSTYICWKTGALCDSKVLYGLSKSNLSTVVYTSNTDTNHCSFLSNLLPNSKYFYVVNQSNSIMSIDTFYFYTAPLQGSNQKIRFLALGDCGSGYIQQYNVKSAVNYYNKNNYINGVLLLGDNAYVSGIQNEYQLGFFNPYQSNFILSNSCIYPAPGNHDYGNNYSLAINHQIPYYDIFKVPQNGELGGLASHHKEFYSYNYANTHFVSLDSYGIELGMYHLWDSLGPQYKWLEQDLKQDKSKWKIVYFHHPPFTMGSHNSDAELDLVAIRKNIARLLERYGVDLVINGHSHNYERSWLQKGHYDMEPTFNKSIHTLDSSSAKYDGSLNSCPYKKDTIDNKGTVYIVAGESGKIGGVQFSYPHNSKYVSEYQKAGALFLEIEENRLDAFYLEEDSLIHDRFTIFKNVNRHRYIIGEPNQILNISASWPGTYNWLFNGSTNKTETIFFNGNADYIVKDSLNCLADTFSVGVSGRYECLIDAYIKIFPNPVCDKLKIEYMDLNLEADYFISNEKGQQITKSKIVFVNGKAEIDLSPLNLSNATYYINLKISEKNYVKPFFVNR